MTAWSPATPFYVEVSTDFPELTFTHYFADEGGGFIGFETIQNGEIIESGDYKWQSKQAQKVRELLGLETSDEDEMDSVSI